MQWTAFLKEFQLVASYALIPYIIAVVMPGRRWLLGCALLLGGPLAAVWIQHWIAVQRPDYNGGPGDAIGLALLAFISAGFFSGLIARGVTLMLRANGWSKGGLAIIVIGFALPFLSLKAPTAWHAWRQRPPAQACLSAGVAVEVADRQLRVPIDKIFNVWLGREARDQAYNLVSNEKARALCALAENGRQRLRATLVAMRFESLSPGQFDQRCGDVGSGWPKPLCDSREAVVRRQFDKIDVPLKGYIFSDPDVRLGYFGGRLSTYAESRSNAQPRAHSPEIYVTSEQRTPGGDPLTFACTKQNERLGFWDCIAAYRLAGEAYVQYEFRAPPGEINEKGIRVDHVFLTLLGALRESRP